MEQEIASKVQAAVAQRNQRRDDWAKRLLTILIPIVEERGAVTVSGHEISKKVVSAMCSQGAGWPTLGNREQHILVDDRWSFGPLDLSYFDGRNMQYQNGLPSCHGQDVRTAPIFILKNIAVGLPAMVDATLDALAAESAKAE